jgi:hypothetical protein
MVLGRVVAIDSEGVPAVEHAQAHGAFPARVVSAVGTAELTQAMQGGREVVLAFENSDPGRPIILGILGPAPRALEADIDGKRTRIVAQDEIVLSCGNASITLRRNGRVVVRGTYIETSSEGTNRIKGGQVRIN